MEAREMTLGNLIKLLEPFENSNMFIKEGEFGSYRGYYEDLYLDVGNEEITVRDFLEYVKNDVLDQEFYAYKGGDYLMTENTRIWLAPYGISTSVALLGITVNDDVIGFIGADIHDYA